MGQMVLRVEVLPNGALDAAVEFHAKWIPAARAGLAGNDALVLVFPTAPYDHRGWRLAAIQDLARESAPKRVNAVAGDNEQAIATATDWLAQASGITGQLVAVD